MECCNRLQCRLRFEVLILNSEPRTLECTSSVNRSPASAARLAGCWCFTALGWMIGGAILISLALVLVDFLLRVEDRGFRIASTIALVCALAWTIYRYLLPAIRVPLDDVRLARRVEQRYPELTDRLSSSLNFLNQSEDDAQAGSSELRRAVIAEATAEVEHLNWSAVLDRRPTLIAMGLAGLVVLLATVLVVLCPGDVKVGLARLAWPFSDVAWPRDHQLALCGRSLGLRPDRILKSK